MRNLYGTGHGKEKKRSGLSERHARLAVGAGITLCTFLLETFEYKRNKE
ncbi:abortive infection family protein [Flavobacterium sp. LBUM151]